MYYSYVTRCQKQQLPIEAGCLSKLSETSTELLHLKQDMQLQQQQNDDDNNNKQIRLTHH